MVMLRKADERGTTRIGWLDSRHSFSFNRYYDPAHMGFRGLRVINEDFIAPGGMFGKHPHDNMEIITYVLAGAVEHRDSTGAEGVIRPGDAQRMSAGTGIFHSEANASSTEPLHLYQIWILPRKRGIEPGYEQKSFSSEERKNRLRVIAAEDGQEGAVTLYADASLAVGELDPGVQVRHALEKGRGAWVQVARGAVTVNGTRALAGDGVAIEDEDALVIQADEASEVLVFDLG